MTYKKLAVFLILTIVVGTCGFAQSHPPDPLEITRALIPDVALFGFSTYVFVGSSMNFAQNVCNAPLCLPMVVSSSLLTATSGLQIANNLFVKDEKTHRQLLWATRAGYLTAFLIPLVWDLADPEFDGEDRTGLGISINIPALIGLGLTFLPYPDRRH